MNTQTSNTTANGQDKQLVNGADQSAKPLTDLEVLMARIAMLEKANAELAAKTVKTPATLTLKIGDKGTLSLYGLGRFPVSLYAEQWLRVLEYGKTISEFIAKNRTELDAKAKYAKDHPDEIAKLQAEKAAKAAK